MVKSYRNLLKRRLSHMYEVERLMEDYLEDRLDLLTFINNVKEYYYEYSNVAICLSVSLAKSQILELLQEEISAGIRIEEYTTMQDHHKIEVWLEKIHEESSTEDFEDYSCQRVINYYINTGRTRKFPLDDYTRMEIEEYEKLTNDLKLFFNKIDKIYYSGIRFKEDI